MKKFWELVDRQHQRHFFNVVSVEEWIDLNLMQELAQDTWNLSGNLSLGKLCIRFGTGGMAMFLDLIK